MLKRFAFLPSIIANLFPFANYPKTQSPFDVMKSLLFDIDTSQR
jgi:hypothetical protein